MIGGPEATEEYWPNLIRGESNRALEEVGQTDMGRAFNVQAYKMRRRAVLCALEAAGVSLPSARIYEAGFGVGYYLALWEQGKAVAVAGIDLSSVAVRNVRQRFPSYDLSQGDITELAKRADWGERVGCYDVVTAIDVLYHIVDDRRAAEALRNLKSLVAMGGILLLTEKFPPSGSRLAEHHHVTRRPLSWYADILGPDVQIERLAPVFWCLDPAIPGSAEYGAGDRAARIIWVLLRVGPKYARPGGWLENAAGWAGGHVGLALDRIALGRTRATGNMRIVTARRRTNA
ncbi:MAG: class I SAM-dependent methyltransferase [Acidimicrobiales bacterium]